MLRRTRRDAEVATEDIRELGTIAILTAHDLLLLLVVVATGQQVAKDHLRDPALLCGMLLDRNTVAVILHADNQGVCRRLIARHLNLLDRRTTGLAAAHQSIPCIYNDLVKDLVEARVEGNITVDHLATATSPSIKDPALLGVRIRAADIGIGQLQNVLTVRVLLECASVGHFPVVREGVDP